ncbi:MAG: MOSC domain-containing protein [Actinobacteria bacterium]|nr:MOSC domain-containing protein [Actinomycetota bacterium]
MTNGQTIGTVAAINRYPVKSMQGEALESGVILSGSLEGDRSWGVVSTETSQVLSAKRVSRLLEAKAWLTPAGPEIELPDGTSLAEPGPEADAVLSEWLETPVSLRPAGDTATTFTMSFNVDHEDEDTFEWPTPPGSFLDLSPVHVLTTAALAAAAEGHREGNWSPHRFRPTILVETTDELSGFVENDWVGASLSVRSVVLDITMPTIRCTMPTKAQAAHRLDRDLQIFKSLAAQNEQNLGAYATVRSPGTVRVGDPVELLAV